MGLGYLQDPEHQSDLVFPELLEDLEYLLVLEYLQDLGYLQDLVFPEHLEDLGSLGIL